MNEGWPEEAYERLQAYITESIRLRALTPAALVWEAVGRGLVDDPLIVEMATRLDPHWADRSDPEQEWPGERDEC